jgi:Transcriptional regulator
MSRYPAGHKEQTRQRIVDAASCRFRSDGLDGTGVAALMSDAGLTNGAFYAHFSSKDELAGAVVASQMHAQAEAFDQAAEHGEGLDRVIAEYLCTAHRDDRPGGCVSAALLSDLGRAAPEIRRRYTESLPELTASFRRLAQLPDEVADATVLSRLALLVGTLQVARAVDDPELSRAVLIEGRRAIHALLATDRG